MVSARGTLQQPGGPPSVNRLPIETELDEADSRSKVASTVVGVTASWPDCNWRFQGGSKSNTAIQYLQCNVSSRSVWHVSKPWRLKLSKAAGQTGRTS